MRPRSFAALTSRFHSFLIPATLLAVTLAAPTARAQDVPEPAPAPPPTAPAPAPEPPPPAAEPELLGDEQALYEEEVGTERQYSRAHPHEEEGRSYNFLGAFYRHHFLPSSVMELFLAEAPSENFPQFGGEFIHRKDGFDIIASVYYADFNGSGPFLANGDPRTDIEWIDSDLWAVMGGVTFLWGSHFSDWFAIQYGLGIGVGALLGDLVRTEAYPTADGHARCETPAAPNTAGTERPGEPFVSPDGIETISSYCAPASTPGAVTDGDGDTGEHYGVTARKWLDGGSTPNLWFRFAPQISLRFKPMHQILFRIDGGFDLFSGFFVGGAAAFGF